MKALVIRFGAIGDLVLTTPVVRTLKRAGYTLHFLLLRQYREVLATNPYIDAFHDYDVSTYLNQKLRDEAFDVVIDLQNDDTSRYFTKALGVKTLYSPRRRWTSFLFKTVHRGGAPKQHQVDRHFAAVAALGIRNDGEGLDFFIAPADEVPYSDIPTSHQLGFLALVIGGSASTKRLPQEQLKAFCQQLQHPIILLGGPEDAARGEELHYLDPIKIYNACGKFSFAESADLLRKARLVVTHDTGLMHVAAALKKPIITVWGSTVPAQGMTPYYGEQHALRNPGLSEDMQVEHLWCRPCTDNGRAHCPLGHFKCMRKIDMNVLQAIAEGRLWKKD
jgi:ADP-heptose:LPS heptosyltransferase